MKIAIYDSKVCKNQMLKKPIEGMLPVNFTEHCSWCCAAHQFYLKEVVEE